MLNLNPTAAGNVTIASGVEVLLNSGTFTSSGVDFSGGKLISAGGGGVWLESHGRYLAGFCDDACCCTGPDQPCGCEGLPSRAPAPEDDRRQH